jgi:alkanesulfonate monooxygenase SsuD/methylene tetrahydromethanopterin reductase-like flavin-dependent oxidoreductase (luciferase family)
MRPLEFGWYLPTHGDTTAYGVAAAEVAGSPELCERVVSAAEAAGFEYLLIPVGSTCWEAWISGAFMAARSQTIKPLIAARPGYINPVLLAKMISTFDQMSGGRICVNLIAGQNESEVVAEGVRHAKEERYALMEEEVSILKALWTAPGPLDFKGRFHTLSGARVRPRPLQKPYPKFYLGGGSREAWEISAKHSDVHLFWGDLPERIASKIAEIRALARPHGRENEIGFGMRLKIICRENETDAWRPPTFWCATRPSGSRRRGGRSTTIRWPICACNSSPANTAICYCRICGPASPASGRAPASRWSAIPPNAPTRCSNSSTPAVIRSACPAICTTRRPSVLGDLSARSWPRTIAAGWRRDPRPREGGDP